jgi:NAD(P)-dependent dehydrogenase (short-subunit alcohol dehydrogenase family)
VEGFTEAISQELKPEWGIKLTCVEPGGFRTDWAGRSMDFGENKNPAYDHIDSKKAMGERHGKQAGDPAKAAKAFYELAIMKVRILNIEFKEDLTNSEKRRILH